MDPETKAFLDGLAASIAALNTTVTAQNEKITALSAPMAAAAEVVARVEPHAAALDALAAAMEASGISAAAETSFPAMARGMAIQMRLQARTGGLPVAYDFPARTVMTASAPAAPDAAAKAEIDALKASVASLNTTLADLKATRRDASPEPARRTLAPDVTTLLARVGLTASEMTDGKIPTAKLDAAMLAMHMPIEQRMTLKAGLKSILA